MFFIVMILIIGIFITVFEINSEQKYKKLESEVLNELGFSDWQIISYIDKFIMVKSRQALDKYDDLKFFKEDQERFNQAKQIIEKKNELDKILRNFLNNNQFKGRYQYKRIENQINAVLWKAAAYRISVNYISPAGNRLGEKVMNITKLDIDRFKNDPSLLLGKCEYNKYLKEQRKEALNLKQHKYYDSVNEIIDYANANRDNLEIHGSQEKLDSLITQLFDRTVNSIKKIKTFDSEEWDTIGNFIIHIKSEMEKIINQNKKVLAYYTSADFAKIKNSCAVLMSSQKEFNEYINEKVNSISKFFGTKVVRNETINDDEYNYIRPYKRQLHHSPLKFLQQCLLVLKTTL